MTVKELREKLAEMRQDAIICLENHSDYGTDHILINRVFVCREEEKEDKLDYVCIDGDDLWA